jgi:hypothetical protein
MRIRLNPDPKDPATHGTISEIVLRICRTHLDRRENHAVGRLPVLAVVIQRLEQQLRGGRAAEVQSNNLHSVGICTCVAISAKVVSNVVS